MLGSTEIKKKLILSSSFITLAIISLIIGKTLANTLILTAYSTKILPYFYFALALFTIASTLIFRRYQQRSPKKLAIIFKIIVLGSLVGFGIILHQGGTILPFFVAILLLIYMSLSSLIAWNYASDIFDIQQYKQFSKIFQLSATGGSIIAGFMVALLSSSFNPVLLIALIFVVESVSLFFIAPLSKYVISLPAPKTKLGLGQTIKRNSIFKYLALMTVASIIIGTLIDYNLKLELIAQIDKQHIARVLSIIFVITTTIVLLIQLFLIDYLFRILGSKKIIIIYPIAILLFSLATLVDFNFILMAILFIANDVFNNTTQSLSRNLYFNIMPRSVRILERLKLNGTISPIATIIASGIVLVITYVSSKLLFSMIIIIVLCVYSIYLAKILIDKYRLELIQSLYLRRFNTELINMSNMDNQEIDYVLKQALSYPEPEAQLIGLELLLKNKTLQLPQALTSILTSDNHLLVYEAAKVLAQHRHNRHFVEVATQVFLKSQHEETQWSLALYLMETDTVEFLQKTRPLLHKKKGVFIAIICLVYIKYGNLEQQIKGMKNLLAMFNSYNIDQKKWFLHVLRELHLPRKEKYLLQFIKQQESSLQVLALQQIDSQVSPYLVNSLVNLIGKKSIVHTVSVRLVEIGEPAIPSILAKFHNDDTTSVKQACIHILSLIPGVQAELALMKLLQDTQNMVMKTIAAKYIAYRGVKIKISTELHAFLIDMIKAELQFYYELKSEYQQSQNKLITAEIKSRIQFIKHRVLYYTTAIIGSADILNSSALLTAYSTDKNQQSLALELIDSTIENREIAELLSTLYLDKRIKGVSSTRTVSDPWLNDYILKVEKNQMDSIYMLTKLRRVDLFKNLAAETLQVLATCCSSQDMTAGEVIFNEGDAGDGLYIIDSGEVTVTKNGVLIGTLAEYAYFGEMALLADIPRFATTTASSDGVLFYIDKQDFDRISDEIPEIMKSINKQVIKYLTDNENIA